MLLMTLYTTGTRRAEAVPQGLKPLSLFSTYGMAEAVSLTHRFTARLQPCRKRNET
jgi:hypothetical protein